MASFLKKLYMKQRHSQINEEIQLSFLKRLYHLLKSGYPIIEALEVMSWDDNFQPICQIMIHYLKKGSSMHHVFDKANFHESIVAYLYFVSINGNLLLSLKKCIEMFEHRIQYLKKFRRIIRYPFVLTIFFTILLFFLRQSVLPSFIELFRMSNDASQTALYLLIFIDYFTLVIFISFTVILIKMLIWFRVKDKIPIETKIKLYRKVPVYRAYLTMQTSYYLSTHLSMFLKAGLSMKEILQSISNQNKLPIIQHYANLMMLQLSQGQRIDHLLLGLPFIEKQVAHIFQKNEDVTSLERDLTTYADFILEKMERKIMQIIEFIQPTFFVLLALFIIFIYASLMWPMFQVINTV